MNILFVGCTLHTWLITINWKQIQYCGYTCIGIAYSQNLYLLQWKMIKIMWMLKKIMYILIVQWRLQFVFTQWQYQKVNLFKNMYNLSAFLSTRSHTFTFVKRRTIFKILFLFMYVFCLTFTLLHAFLDSNSTIQNVVTNISPNDLIFRQFVME